MSSRCARRAGVVGPLLRWIAVGALVVSAAASPRVAFGDPTREDRAAATALFDEGRRLAGEKKYAEACPKFEAAMRLDPGIGTLYNLSDCYEQIGRTASAWAGFRDVAAQAKAANQSDREKVARDRVTALEPKLSKIRIVMPADFAGGTFTITRDGSPLPTALIGSPIPFDPGSHTLRIEVEGKQPWEKKIDVPAKGGTTDVQVPSFVPKSASAPSNTGSPAGTSTGTVPVETAAPTATLAPTATEAPTSGPGQSPRPWQKPLGIGALAVGVAGLGAGVALGVVAKGMYDDSNKSDCDPKTNFCNDSGLKTRASAVDMGNLGTIVGIAGGVVGAAGLVLWILAPSAQAPTKSGGVSDVHVVAGPGSVGVSGKF